MGAAITGHLHITYVQITSAIGTKHNLSLRSMPFHNFRFGQKLLLHSMLWINLLNVMIKRNIYKKLDKV